MNSFILKLFFTGLMAFVPSQDGKEVTVLLLNVHHDYQSSDGTALAHHKPLLIARAGDCSGECPKRDAGHRAVRLRRPIRNAGARFAGSGCRRRRRMGAGEFRALHSEGKSERSRPACAEHRSERPHRDHPHHGGRARGFQLGGRHAADRAVRLRVQHRSPRLAASRTRRRAPAAAQRQGLHVPRRAHRQQRHARALRTPRRDRRLRRRIRRPSPPGSARRSRSPARTSRSSKRSSTAAPDVR